jgi:hypothetical protein
VSFCNSVEMVAGWRRIFIETSRESRGIYRRAWLGLGARVLARREIGRRRRFPCSGRSRGDDDLVRQAGPACQRVSAARGVPLRPAGKWAGPAIRPGPNSAPQPFSPFFILFAFLFLLF